MYIVRAFVLQLRPGAPALAVIHTMYIDIYTYINNDISR